MTFSKSTRGADTAKGKRVALYVRVSTANGQTTDNQRRELEAVAERSRWHVVETYEDAGVSGAKRRDERPAFDRLCKDAAQRKFELVAAWSVDRLGRSLPDLVAFLGELHALGVDLYLHQQAVDTTTPAGRALFQMMSVFAEFERAMIRERVMAGLARARASGKRLGRPRMPEHKRRSVKELRTRGTSIRRIAREVDISPTTVQAILAEGCPAPTGRARRSERNRTALAGVGPGCGGSC